MSLLVEDGTGLQGAEAYASVAFVDAYWVSRPQDPNAVVWAALGTSNKEGSIRVSTDYLDQVYGPRYIGTRKGRVQGLLWPRNAEDEAGYPLPDLPDQLPRAVAELAPRASSGPLAPDVTQTGLVTRETKKVGPIETSKEYASPVTGTNGTSTARVFGTVDGLMSELVSSGRGATAGAGWDWA